MCADSGAPNPGPRPQSLEFPFAAAEAAIAAIKAKIDHLKSFQTRHGEAVASARVDFAGPLRQQFDRELGGGMTAIDDFLGKLHTDLAQLEGIVADARRAVRARQDEIAAWQRKKNAYDQAEEAARRQEAGRR